MRNIVEEEQTRVSLTGISLAKAKMADIHPLLNLINAYAQQGIMLPRTEFEISENIRDFTLAFEGSKLLACGALHIYSPYAAEVRSLAVDPILKGHGIGKLIVQALETEGRQFGLHSLFAFTYVEQFFTKLGFSVVDRGELPLKAWKDCLRCPKFQCCDEIAVMKHLVENPAHSALRTAVTEFVQLPIRRG